MQFLNTKKGDALTVIFVKKKPTSMFESKERFTFTFKFSFKVISSLEFVWQTKKLEGFAEF